MSILIYLREATEKINFKKPLFLVVRRILRTRTAVTYCSVNFDGHIKLVQLLFHIVLHVTLVGVVGQNSIVAEMYTMGTWVEDINRWGVLSKREAPANIPSLTTLKRVYGFPTYAKLTRKSESVGCAVKNSNNVGISAILLSLMPEIMLASGRNGTKRPLGFLKTFRLDFIVEGAQAKAFVDLVRMGTSSAKVVWSLLSILRRESASAA